MKLDKKKRYTIEDGTQLYTYIAHDSKCILLRNTEDGLINQVPLTARLFEQIPHWDERLLKFTMELKSKTLPRIKIHAYIVDLLAKHHLKVVDLEAQPVNVSKQVSIWAS